MSRVGRTPIIIVSGAKIDVKGSDVEVNGPKGTLTYGLVEGVEVKVEEGKAMVTVSDPEMGNLAGLTRTNIFNMMKGVTEGWNKVLELNGTGYRASVAGKDLQLALGFSHPVTVAAPEGISFAVKENKITVSGADKVAVGEVAAKIRKLRPADPYKAKGFKYEGEYIAKKAGKAAKAGGTAGK